MATDIDLTSYPVDLKVLSQLPHPHSTIQFHGLRAGTSIRELKQLIRDAVSTHPLVDTQRLIYRGRLLNSDMDTLIDVFGKETIQRGETHPLHLVIRGGAPQSVSGSSSGVSQDSVRLPSPSNPTSMPPANPQITNQQHLASHLVPTPPSHAAAVQGPSRNHSPVPGSHINVQHYTQHQQGSATPPRNPINPPPVAFQTPFQSQHLRTMPQNFQYIHQQIHHQPGTHPQIGLNPAIASTNGMLLGNHPAQAQMQPLMAAHQAMVQHQQQAMLQHQQQAMLHQQQHQAILQQHNPQNRANPSFSVLPANNVQPSSSQRSDVDAPSTAPQAQHRINETGSDERHNGQSDQPDQSSNENAIQFSHQHIPPFSFPFTPAFSSPGQQFIPGTGFPVGSHLPGTAGFLHHNTGPSRQHPQYMGWLGPTHAIDYLQNLQNRLEMALHLCRWSYPPEDDPTRPAVVTHGLIFLRDLVNLRNAAQVIINVVLRDGPPGGQSAPTPQQVSILQSLNYRFREIVLDWSSDIERVQSGRYNSNAPANPTAPTSTTNLSLPSINPNAQPTAHPNQASSVAYILNSPTGPSAVVYNTQGTFFSNPVASPSTGSRSSIQQNTANLSNAITLNQQPRPPTENQQVAVNPARIQLNNANGERLRQALQQEQPGNVIAINLTPVFQGVWLFIRVYVFIWVFLGGRGLGQHFLSWRTLLLFLLCAAYWALRVGIGAERIEALRRYWNDLFGFEAAHGDQRRQDEQPNNQNRQGDQARANDPASTAPNAGVQQSPDQLLRQELSGRQQANPERQIPDGSLRQLFRPLERTLALFLGSLYPGFGERRIAESERMRREAEERDRARAATAAQDAQTEAQNSSFADTSASGNRGNSPNRQVADTNSGRNLSAYTGDNIDKHETRMDQNESRGSSSAVDVTDGQERVAERRNAPNLEP